MTNQEPNLNRIVFEVDEDYEFDYEIIVSNEGDNDVLITIPDTIEIVLKNFHTSKTLQNSLPCTDDSFTSVNLSYPLDELPEDCTGLSMVDLLQLPKTTLQLVIVSEKLTEVIRKQSTLWIGDSFSMKLPYYFAEKLQNFLLSGELTND